MFGNIGNMGLHIIKCPTGKWIYRGSVPVDLGTEKTATRSDIMGGRAHRNEQGDIVALKFPLFDTRDEGVEFAEGKGHSIKEEN